MRKKTISLIAVCGLFIFAGALAGYTAHRHFAEVKRKQLILEKKRADWGKLKTALENKIHTFNGKLGIVIKDLDTNWEISFNKDTRMPSASLVKIPIMLSCFYAVEEGKISLGDTVRLKSYEKVSGSKVLGDAPSGSTFSVEELLNPMITYSDNTATNVLIDFMGFDVLNAYFDKLGLKNTNLSRKMLDFAGRRAGRENYTTAAEMASLLEKLYCKSFLRKEVSEKCMEILLQQKIKDRIPKNLPKEVPVAHKTGLESRICHDVGIVFTDKGNFLICVLARHNEKYAYTAKKVISDIAQLTYNYYQDLN